MLPRTKSTLYFAVGMTLITLGCIGTTILEEVGSKNLIATLGLFFVVAFGGLLSLASVEFTPEQMQRTEPLDWNKAGQPMDIKLFSPNGETEKQFLNFEFEKLEKILGYKIDSWGYIYDMDSWTCHDKLLVNDKMVSPKKFSRVERLSIRQIKNNLNNFFQAIPEEEIITLIVKNSESNYFGVGDQTSSSSHIEISVVGRKIDKYVFITKSDSDIGIMGGKFYSREFLKELLARKKYEYLTMHGQGGSSWDFINPEQLSDI